MVGKSHKAKKKKKKKKDIVYKVKVTRLERTQKQNIGWSLLVNLES